MKRSGCAAAGALAWLALAGCAGDIRPDSFGEGVTGDVVQVEYNTDGSATVTVNATDDEAWIYLDLGELVQVEPDDPATSADWDIGLQRFHYALDGGVSGAGLGELSVVDEVALADVGGPPADGWVTDQPDDDIDEDTLPELAFETAEGGWYDYDAATHVLKPKERVYVVRGAAGALFAVSIEAYYDEEGTPAWPRFSVKPLDAL